MAANATQPTLEQINAVLRPSLGTFLLPWLAGQWLGAIFTGLICMLVYRYTSLYPRKQDDRLIYRIVVALILIFQLGQTTSDFHAMWYFTINCFGNDLCIRIAPTSEIVSYAFILGTNATCQSYFAVRAIKMYESLSLRILFTTIIGGGVLFNLGSGIFSVIKLFEGRNFADTKAVAAVFSSNRMAVWGYCGTDACIAILLVYKLIVTKKHTDFKDTHRLINRLMAYALGTTSVVFIMAACSAGLSQMVSAMDQRFITIFMNIPRVYAMSVLFTLLTRKSNAAWLGSASTSSRGSQSRGSPQTSRNGHRRVFSNSTNEPKVVRVQLETVQTEDQSFDTLDEKYAEQYPVPRLQHPYAAQQV